MHIGSSNSNDCNLRLRFRFLLLCRHARVRESGGEVPLVRVVVDEVAGRVAGNGFGGVFWKQVWALCLIEKETFIVRLIQLWKFFHNFRANITDFFS